MTHAQKEHIKAIKDVDEASRRLTKAHAAHAAIHDKASQEAQALARKVTLWQTKHEAAADRLAMWQLAVDAQGAGLSGSLSMVGRGSVTF